MGVSVNWGAVLRRPRNRDHDILGSILGPHMFGNPDVNLRDATL